MHSALGALVGMLSQRASAGRESTKRLILENRWRRNFEFIINHSLHPAAEMRIADLKLLEIHVPRLPRCAPTPADSSLDLQLITIQRY